jgi:hypothetical protein
MNENLIRYLEINRDELVSQWGDGLKTAWNSRITSDSMSGNQRSTRITSFCTCGISRTEMMFSILVNRYYDDLLMILKNTSNQSNEAGEFPHFSPYGVRLNLGALLEILLEGENVFSRRFLDEVNPYFSGIKGIDAFQEILVSLRKIFRGYSQTFCNECVSCLTNSIQRIAKQTKTNFKKDEIYERITFPN